MSLIEDSRESRPDHVTLTASIDRQNVLSEAEIVELESISTHVKRIRLHIMNDAVQFQPGQVKT